MSSVRAAQLAFVAVLALAGPIVGGCEDGLVQDPIETTAGSISGTTQGWAPTLHVYKGVPFAAPPVGDLRWRPPQPPPAWTGVRECIAFGPVCPQPDPGLGTPPPMSEDCLYLNVWTPAVRRSDLLPVMVWIHGGAFVTGSGSTGVYDGASLAGRGVVIVTINYRLGPFGFLAHPALSEESALGVSGNYGLLDQIAALEWVRDNIVNFGGDPRKVTIFGESAGGFSVSCHMVSPRSQGLFHRAIAQSGIAMDLPTLRGAVSMEALGERIASALGASGAAELRARTAEELMAAAAAVQGPLGSPDWLMPAVDGWLLPGQPASRFEAGLQHDVPFMAGTNADEGTLFTGLVPARTVAEYREWLATQFGAAAVDRLFAMFPAATDADVHPAVARVITVGMFMMPARFAVRAMEAKASNAWLYHFTRAIFALRLAGLGATHASELPYVFGNLMLGLYEGVDYAISDAMGAAWVRFAATGNPNAAGSTLWPVYERATDGHLEFGETIQAGTQLRQAACDLAEEVWREGR